VSSHSTDPRDRVTPFLTLVETALRSRAGNGVRFTRSRLGWIYPRPWFAVSEEELSGLLPSPEAGAGRWPSPRRGHDPFLPLGRNARGDVIGPEVEALEGRHLALLGETGMGKSSTLIAIAHRAVRIGGVVLFDPVGETAQRFLSGLRGEDCARVVRIGPDEANAGINALEGVGGESTDSVLADRRLGDLVHALRRVRSGRYVSNNFWGPRLEEMLVRALRAAASFPGGTISDAHRLLDSPRWNPSAVPEPARDHVLALIDRIRQRPEDADGARRLLYEVVRSPVLKRLLCEREPRVRVRSLVRPGRIAVISGEAATIGEPAARYLLAVYLALVWSELLARPGTPKTFVMLDEAQWFSHETLAEMLRLARRRNVHVVLATQAVASLPEEVGEALWTNTSDFLAFRGSPEEAREISRTAPSVPMDELLALPRGRAVALLGKGNEVYRVRTAGRSTVPSTLAEGRPTPPLALVRDTSSSEPAPEPGARPETPVLAWLRDRCPPPNSGGAVTVGLSEIRKSVDPTGAGVAAAGALLGRAGALIGRRKTAQGVVWTIDPARLRAVLDLTEPPPISEAAEGPQPS